MNSWHLLFFNFAVLFYTLSTFIYLINFFYKKKLIKSNLNHIFLIAAILFQSLFIVTRWSIIGNAPMTSMFEYLNILSFFVALSYLFMYRVFKLEMIGLMVNIIILLVIIFSSLFSKEVTPLVPALNSYWLGLHVSLAAFGEGLFTISFVASFLYLIKTSSKGRLSKIVLEALLFLLIHLINFLLIYIFTGKTFSFYSLIGVIIYFLIILGKRTLLIDLLDKKLKLQNLDVLDQLSYQSIAFGYPIFTLGALVFAMIWAEQAWGSYWSWDPKETWALISWLFYGLYLHLRLLKSWQEKETAWVSVIGFVIILFTLLGVTYLMPGNHAYI